MCGMVGNTIGLLKCTHVVNSKLFPCMWMEIMISNVIVGWPYCFIISDIHSWLSPWVVTLQCIYIYILAINDKQYYIFWWLGHYILIKIDYGMWKVLNISNTLPLKRPCHKMTKTLQTGIKTVRFVNVFNITAC